MMKIIGIVALLVFATGCGTIQARWTEASPAYNTGAYRGVRFYAHHIGGKERSGNGNDAVEKDRPPAFEHHCYGWLPVFIVALPFLAADALVLTPVFDTLLLPYDLITW